MANPASGTRQYFLGIGGTQSGPHSESDIAQKIAQGQANAETLVWYEGLPEWQPLSSIAVLNDLLTQGVKEAPRAVVPAALPKLQEVSDPPGARPHPAEASKVDQSDDPLEMGKPGEPVFDESESTFASTTFIRYRIHLLLVGTILVVTVVSVIGSKIVSSLAAPSMVKDLINKAPIVTPREERMRKALSELQVSPATSVATLVQLAKEKIDDKVGQESLAAAVDFYRRDQQPLEGARLLMFAKKPTEAAKLLISQPTTNAAELDKIVMAAYEEKKDKDLLRGDVDAQLAQGLQTNQALVTERLRKLAADFPGEVGTYGYYLKSDEGKLVDLFSRLAFTFVQNLSNFVSSEFPQMTLAKRPLVELVKEKDGTYRIVGTYHGELNLNHDSLRDIHFVFWWAEDQWHLVDTNLTAERKKFSQLEHDQWKTSSLSATDLLHDLEQLFRRNFPKVHLHEPIPQAPVVGKAHSTY